MIKDEKNNMKPVITPSIGIFVSSTAETTREWIYREVLRYFPESVFGLTRMIHIDSSWEESIFVPPSGDPSLDEKRMNPGSFFGLSDETVDLAGQIEEGKFPQLRFAPLRLMELGSAKTGARNAPALGRILFLWNQTELKNFLSEQVLGVLRNQEQVRAIEADFEVARVDICAYIVWSPGGTGSGIATGCASLIREISEDLNLPITIAGIKLRPGAFKSSSDWRLSANAYANDMELYAIQSGRLIQVESVMGERED